MGVRRKLIRDLLSSLKYIKNLSEEQIRASLWRGEGTLYNIEFEPGKLQALLAEVCPVALEILRVHVDELYIRIPWSQLGTQSVLIVAKNVDVAFNLHCEDEEEWRDYIGPMLRKLHHTAQDTLAAAPGSLGDPAGTFNQLQKRLLHSLQIQAGHIHISIASRHRRHFSAHRAPPADEPRSDMIDGPPEEAIIIEFDDLLLSPCDSERVPSDHMKAMAVFEPSERVLTLTRLLKCRAFRVIPPKGVSQVCPCASEEYMDAPGLMTCFIVDRCTSDGPRICPVLLRTELNFDLPSPLKVKASECQLDSFMAMLSDIGQLEEWRLDETIVGEKRSKLLDCTEVARTFARGPEWQRQKPPSESLATSLASGLSAGTSSLWKMVTNESSKKKPASGFHPAGVTNSHEGSPERARAVELPGSGQPGERSRSRPESRQETPTSDNGSGVDLTSEVLPSATIARVPSALESSTPSAPGSQLPTLAIPQKQSPSAGEGAGTTSLNGCAPSPSEHVKFSSPISEEQEMEQEQEHPAIRAYFEEVDEDSDGEDDDYFSVRSRSKCSSPRPRDPAAVDKKHKGSMPTNWIDAMSSWFGVKPPEAAAEGQDASGCVDLCTQFNRIEVTFSSLVVHVAVPGAEGASAIEVGGERLRICLDTTYELTEAQRECVRRFAWPDQEPPAREFRLQLPKRVAGSQLITWYEFAVCVGGEELLRSVDRDDAKSREPMLALSIRPRGAPPEVLPSQEAGEFTAWPSHLRLANAYIAVQPTAFQEVFEVFKRLQPFLVGKVPQPDLIAPEGRAVAREEGSRANSKSAQPGVYPAQCLSIEFCHVEFLEALPEAATIQMERRWPWRGTVPHLVMRSESALWDLSDILRVSAGPGAAAPSPPSPSSMSRSGSISNNLVDNAEGMVSIPKELFDELVRRAAEITKKDSQVSAAREELQRAYITLASSKRGSPSQHHGVGASSSSGAGSRTKAPAGADRDSSSSDNEQDELNRLRQKCLQLEISLQSQARSQRRLETELAHHQALAQEELRRLLATARGPRGMR